MKLTGLGEVQTSAVNVYILDPAHREFEGEPPIILEGKTMHVIDRDCALDLLVDAANSAGDSGDREFGDALHKLASRILRGSK